MRKRLGFSRLGLTAAGTALLLATLALPLPAQDAEAPSAGERILAYHSDITVNADGSMRVRETIRVRAEGDRIKRGIYRDFPTRYKDRYGNRVVVGFEVLEVQRGGKPEPYHTEGLSNGVRVYIGEKSVLLDPGEYTYAITYRTERQLGFFPDHDELYWNVTGNGWDFEIDRASATVELPRGIKPQAMVLDGYTGPQGSLGRAFEAEVEGESRASFVTIAPLRPAEGLTIVVSFPKRFIAEPTREMKMQWFIDDNRNALVGLVGLVVLFAYYMVAWVLVGRDPDRGIIMPLYQPPAGLSPAGVRFLAQMGFDDKTFAAAVINLAVKRHVHLKEKDGVYTVTRTSQPAKAELSAEEKTVLNRLLDKSDNIELKNTNHSRIKSAVDALRLALQLNMEKVYFFRNRRYLIPGLILSVLLLVIVVLATPGEGKIVGIFMTVWLTGWSVGVFFLVTQVVRAWRGVASSRGGSKLVAAGGAAFISLFAIPFLGGEVAGLVFLAYSTSVSVIIILALAAGMDYLFHHLLKAPTRAGRQLLDQVEGFKMFLAPTEKDRLNVLTPASKTPEVFERYLPYALALDVEQEWSEQFSDVLAKAGQGGAEYSPTWYSGSHWSAIGASGFASSLGSSFSGAISSSSTAPGRSSGSGGGGSSGGGGGGGGGGGW